MNREIKRFEALWGVRSDVSDVSISADGEIGSVSIKTAPADDNWDTETDFNFLVLDRIVLADFDRPLPVRLAKYLFAFGDFVVTGTAFRFFAKAWRFGLYFLYPFLVLALFAAAGYAAARWTVQWLGVVSWLVGLVVFHSACRSGQAMVNQPSDGSMVVFAQFHSGKTTGCRIPDAAICSRYRRTHHRETL